METFVNFCLKMQNHFQEFLLIIIIRLAHSPWEYFGYSGYLIALIMALCSCLGAIFIHNQHFTLAHDVDLYSLYIVTSLKLGSNFRR